MAARSWLTIRIFVSSTFLDMQAERDHLVRFVFPRLRDTLLARQVHLVDIDLRWGVTSEQDALSVCRNVVDECQPRILCLLGGRYGWIPPGEERSITADEVHYGALRPGDRRNCKFFYFRDPAVTASMIELRPGEFREEPGSEKEAKLKALKQEVVSASFEPVVYRARWDERKGRLVDLEEFGERVYTQLLESVVTEVGDLEEEEDEFGRERAAMEAVVEERTERWILGSRERVWRQVENFARRPEGGLLCVTGEPGSGKTAFLAKLYRETGVSRPDDLVIAHVVGATSGSSRPEAMLRRLCHELYVQARLDLHRDNALARLQRESEGKLKGLGVSFEDKAKRREIESAAEAESSRIRNEYVLAADPDELRHQFSRFVGLAASRQNVLILVDAVNQLEPFGRLGRMNWIPATLPRYARMIVSTVPGAALEELRARSTAPLEADLPRLIREDSNQIATQALHRYRKTLSPPQLAALLGKQDAGTPLYLLTSVEELRTLGTHEELLAAIQALPETSTALFAWVLQRLEGDPGLRSADDASPLALRFGALLAAAGDGLSQRELIELLEPGDPRGNVAALLRLLRPYLMRRGELLDFYHGQFRAAAEGRYLHSEGATRESHAALAAYFRTQADPAGDESWSATSDRPFLKLPYHLVRGDRDVAVSLLLSFAWLQAKSERGLVYEILKDLDDLANHLRRGDPVAAAVEAIQDSLRLSASAIFSDTSQLAGQMLGRLDPKLHPCVARLLNDAGNWTGGAWLEPDGPKLLPPGSDIVRIVDAHLSGLTLLTIAPDGRRLISSAAESTKIWDAEAGTLLRTLSDLGDSVRSVHFPPDGETMVTASVRGAVRTWDLDTGKLLGNLASPSPGDVYELRNFAPTLALGETAVVCGDADGAVRVWDLASGDVLHVLREPDREMPREPAPETVAWAERSDEPPTATVQAESGTDSASSDSGFNPFDDDGFDLTLEGFDDEELLFELGDDDGFADEERPAPPRPEVLASLDGRRLVAEIGGKIYVWDLGMIGELASKTIALDDQAYGKRRLKLSPDGRIVRVEASGTAPYAVDLETNLRCKKTPSGPWLDTPSEKANSPRRAVSFGSVIVEEQDAGMLVWRDSRRSSSRSPPPSEPGIRAITFRRDGGRGFALATDGSIRTWTPGMNAFSEPVFCVEGCEAVALSSDGETALTSLRLESAGDLIAAIDDDYLILDEEIEDDERSAVLPSRRARKEGLWSRLWRSLTATRGASRSRKNAPTPKDRSPLALRHLSEGRPILEFGDSDAEAEASDFLCDSSLVALAADAQLGLSAGEFEISGWNLRTGQKVFRLGRFPRAWNPPLTMADCTALVYDPYRDQAAVRSLALSDDGKTAISGMNDGSVRVWDLDRQAESRRLIAGRNDVAVALTPSGRRAASLCDSLVKVWDVASGREVFAHALERQVRVARGAGSIALDESGTSALVAEGRSVLLCRVEPEIRTARFSCDRTVSACALSSDGETALVADRTGRLFVLRARNLRP